MPQGRAPRTDFGTVILHAVLVITFAVLVATGLRIASDDPESMWLIALDPILPVEHLWYWHMVSGVGMAAALGGYGAYVVRARLQSRIRLDGARLAAILRGGQVRWSALGTVVVWILIAALVVEVVTGTVLFIGGGSAVVALHRWATWICLLSVGAHICLHAAFGGISQLLRVVRPSRLNIPEPPPDLAALLAEQLERQASARADTSTTESLQESPPAPTLKAHPLATCAAVALVIAGFAWGGESLTRPELKIAEVSRGEVPVLDGELSDPVWAKAHPVTVLTTQGGDFGGSHQSLVEVRAVHDGEYAYFAFVWDDPTRSLKHFPLVKRADGWFIASAHGTLADEDVYHEDKFSVLLTHPGLPLIGGAIHLAKAPLRNKPAGASGRGLHFTKDGGIADVWLWRASHGGPGGQIENCHFGPPAEMHRADSGETAAYTGGFSRDPGPAEDEPNFLTVRLDGVESIRPRRLPADLAATRRAMGRVSNSAQESEAEGTRWWMSLSESVPYSPQADAAIPVGTIIPGVLVPDALEDRRDAIRGMAKWASGRWTLELRRRLHTGSAYDVPIKSGTLLWVAAFDHAEKRHTRHLRPLRIEVE